jgi:multiple sugar transport system substrate-binding protein
MRWKPLMIAAAVLPFTLGVWGCRRAAQKTGGPVEVTVWHPMGGDEGKALQRVVDRYNRAHPGVVVRLVYTPTDNSTNQKFFTSIAAGKPPDITFVDATQDGQWVEQGALMPLDDYVRRSGLKASDFFPPVWDQALYKGHIWSLVYCADPNFAFAWNKAAFRKAGLDPNRPPRTIAELDAMARKLTVVRGSRIEAMGIIPWAQYGSANSVFTWGWAFGGRFYDDRAKKVTADDPKIVAALTWMTGYAKRLGITRINSSASGWGSGVADPFITGQVAMRCMHLATLKDVKRYAPGLEMGLAPMPGMPDGEIGSSWIGGWSLAMPKGCKHPDEAWAFMH